MQPFGETCLHAYFSDDCSEFDLIIINAGLYSLCSDYSDSTTITADEKAEYVSYAQSCRQALETQLRNIPLYLVASSNVIAGLLFGVGRRPYLKSALADDPSRHSTPSDRASPSSQAWAGRPHRAQTTSPTRTSSPPSQNCPQPPQDRTLPGAFPARVPSWQHTT